MDKCIPADAVLCILIHLAYNLTRTSFNLVDLVEQLSHWRMLEKWWIEVHPNTIKVYYSSIGCWSLKSLTCWSFKSFPGAEMVSSPSFEFFPMLESFECFPMLESSELLGFPWNLCNRKNTKALRPTRWAQILKQKMHYEKNEYPGF